MRRAPVLLLGIALAVLPISPLRAQEPAAPAAPVDSVRLALARELLLVTQADQAFYRGVELALPGQRAANPKIPEIFWTEFMQRIKDGLPSFTARVAPIYASRLTAEDLRAIIAFYRTPAGQHFAREQVDLARQHVAHAVGLARQLPGELGLHLALLRLAPVGTRAAPVGVHRHGGGDDERLAIGQPAQVGDGAGQLA